MSHYSALVLKDLPIDDADLELVHLTPSQDRQTRRQPSFTLHPGGLWRRDAKVGWGCHATSRRPCASGWWT